MSIETVTRVGAFRRDLAARLERAFAADGRDGAARLDARLLLAHALDVAPEELVRRDEDPVDSAVEARALAFVERRIAGEPVARIVGRREFWGLDFHVGRETLVPRPDTETVVEAALAFVDRQGRRDEPLRLLDIGTGSGAILLALLSELPRSSGIGTDISNGALDVARGNARWLALSRRACFVACNWATAVGGEFDLVLANPPYVESNAISGLQLEVRDFDPHLSLDGGADGLLAYRAIFSDLDRLLASMGRAFFEVGFGQAPIVAEMARIGGFSGKAHRDLAGIERVVEIAPAVDG